MPEIRFISDPSLLRKGSRGRALLMSAINSHVTKHKHETQSLTNTPRKRRCHGIEKVHSVAAGQSGGIHTIADAPCLPCAGVRPMYSQYLENTYCGKDELSISSLCAYYMNVAGPLYVWNVTDAENKRTGHREYFIRMFLSEPAFIEAQLAWMCCFFDSEGTGAYAHKILYHQTRSISLMQKLLTDPNKVRDYTVLNTVIANMIINQACGDWTSFEINLNGLTQIIALTGGWEALRRKQVHSHNFVEGLFRTFAERTLKAGTRSVSSTRKFHPRQHRSIPISQSPLLLGVPEKLMALSRDGDMCDDVAMRLGEAISFLEQARLANTSVATCDKLKQQKNMIESVLLHWLNERNLMVSEYSLCLGLLIKLATTTPYGDINPLLLADSKAVSLISTFRDMVMAAVVDDMKGPVLWTCLVILEMPLFAKPSFSTRLAFLRDLMLEVSAQLQWSEIRRLLAQIYLDAELESLWSKFWAQVLRRSSLNPFG